MSVATPSSSSPGSTLVACLCAEWCRTCGEYRALFDSLAAELPQVRFRWIDIEDEADLIDPIEVENFPTLLIAQNGSAGFFGTVTPHLDTLRRLIQSQMAAPEAASSIRDAQLAQAVQGLLKRLQADT